MVCTCVLVPFHVCVSGNIYGFNLSCICVKFWKGFITLKRPNRPLLRTLCGKLRPFHRNITRSHLQTRKLFGLVLYQFFFHQEEFHFVYDMLTSYKFQSELNLRRKSFIRNTSSFQLADPSNFKTYHKALDD